VSKSQEQVVLKRIFLAFIGLVGILVVGFAIFVASRQHLTFDVPYPAIAASTDPAVIARGHYVVRVLANCASCHGDPTRVAEASEGQEMPLSGGNVWNIPPGMIYARNITPDSGTGLGRVSDQAIARAIRYGVGYDGRALLPFMEVQDLSDEDLVAVVSYLRTQAPVNNPVPMHRFTLLGKIVKATVLANPVGPKATPLKTTPHGATVENGRYLVESVVNCWACHTQRNMATGALVGPRFGGATGFDATLEGSWSPPNITADSATGRLGRLTEDGFVARFRMGRVIPHSPMPWQAFQKLSDEDLRAIYQYLKTVPAVVRDVGPPFAEVKK
jgi:mono/diheme cytochrome c family protein